MPPSRASPAYAAPLVLLPAARGALASRSVCRAAPHPRRARARAPLWTRAGLYPEPDEVEDIPNPMRRAGVGDGETEEVEGDGGLDLKKGRDALEDSVLQRARRLFGGIFEDEERRRRRVGGGGADGGEAGAQEPRDGVELLYQPPPPRERDFKGVGIEKPRAKAESSGGGDGDGGGGLGGWFGLGRKGAEEASGVSSRSAEQSRPSVTLHGAVPAPWTADELDVAAAEAIKRDAELGTSGYAAGVGGLAQAPIDIQRASRAFWKVGWWAWWTQLVLTTISGVIVLFALAFPGVSLRSTASASGVVCAGIGVLLAFISLFWTYGYTRLAIRIRRAQPKWIARAPERVAGYLKVALLIALAGLLVSLIGLQAIVGTLLARLFGAGIVTTPYGAVQGGVGNVGQSVVGGIGLVQPVDVLVIQASANAMSALLSAVITAVWLRGRLRSWTGERSWTGDSAKTSGSPNE